MSVADYRNLLIVAGKVNRLRAATALCVSVALLASGCGNGDDESSYVDEINEVELAYNEDVNELVSGAAPSNPGETAEIAGELAELTDRVASDLEAVEAPDEVADLHDQVVSTLRELAGKMSDAEEALSEGNAEEAAAAGADLQSSALDAATELNELTDEINAELAD